MNFFSKDRKQSAEGRKRMKAQIQAAAQDFKEKVYDLSACDMHKVPEKVLGTCEVLCKEALLLHSNVLKNIKFERLTYHLCNLRIIDLHNNRLTALPSEISKLKNLEVLDLHNNRLTALPSEICKLKNLQVLNIENNFITHLPHDIGDLENLTSLHAKDNKLNCIPSKISGAKNLRAIDVSGGNKVLYLPKTLCKIRTLEILLLTNPAKMEYPPPHVAEQGLEEMLRFMCRDCGIEYVPPSLRLGIQQSTTDELVVGPVFESSTVTYQRMKGEREKEEFEMERRNDESRIVEAKIAARSSNMKYKDLEEIAKKQVEFDKLLQTQHKEHDREKEKIEEILQDVNKKASSLTEHHLEAKAQTQEALFEEVEQQRTKEEEYFKVTRKDLDNLRNKKMLETLREMTEEDNQRVIRAQEYQTAQSQVAQKTQDSIVKEAKLIEKNLGKYRESQDHVVDKIVSENPVVTYQLMKAEREKEELEMERRYYESRNVETKIALQSTNMKYTDLEEIAKKKIEFDKLLQMQQKEHDREKRKIEEILRNSNRKASCLADHHLEAKAQKHDELLEMMKQQRNREEEYFKVKKEDLDTLREKEILERLREMSQEDNERAVRVQEYQATQSMVARQTRDSMDMGAKQIEENLEKNRESRDELFGKIVVEEEKEQEEFAALQRSRDVAHSHILQQIGKIETEYAKLAHVELKKHTQEE